MALKASHKIIINLTPEDVKDAIIDHISECYPEYKGRKIEVDLELGTVSTGFGTSERDETVFKGASVELTQ